MEQIQIKENITMSDAWKCLVDELERQYEQLNLVSSELNNSEPISR